MKSKSFLLGMFSVVSFVVVSTFVTPSTFAQCPPDVSGTWVVKEVGMTECCPNQSDNGPLKVKVEIPVVTQIGSAISASWVEGTDTNLLTGIVNGNSVYFSTDSGDPGCGWVGHVVGIIKGNRIKFYYTGAEACNTCREHSKGTIKIVK